MKRLKYTNQSWTVTVSATFLLGTNVAKNYGVSSVSAPSSHLCATMMGPLCRLLRPLLLPFALIGATRSRLPLWTPPPGKRSTRSSRSSRAPLTKRGYSHIVPGMSLFWNVIIACLGPMGFRARCGNNDHAFIILCTVYRLLFDGRARAPPDDMNRSLLVVPPKGSDPHHAPGCPQLVRHPSATRPLSMSSTDHKLLTNAFTIWSSILPLLPAASRLAFVVGACLPMRRALKRGASPTPCVATSALPFSSPTSPRRFLLLLLPGYFAFFEVRAPLPAPF
eukprot:5766018-Pyramimonas_sp.AAC.1